MNIPRLMVGAGIAGLGSLAGGAIMGGNAFGVHSAGDAPTQQRTIGAAIAVAGIATGAVLGWRSLTPLAKVTAQMNPATELLGAVGAWGGATVGGMLAGQGLHNLFSSHVPTSTQAPGAPGAAKHGRA